MAEKTEEQQVYESILGTSVTIEEFNERLNKPWDKEKEILPLRVFLDKDAPWFPRLSVVKHIAKVS